VNYSHEYKLELLGAWQGMSSRPDRGSVRWMKEMRELSSELLYCAETEELQKICTAYVNDINSKLQLRLVA
jgi:hypothetical protein